MKAELKRKRKKRTLRKEDDEPAAPAIEDENSNKETSSLMRTSSFRKRQIVSDDESDREKKNNSDDHRYINQSTNSQNTPRKRVVITDDDDDDVIIMPKKDFNIYKKATQTKLDNQFTSPSSGLAKPEDAGNKPFPWGSLSANPQRASQSRLENFFSHSIVKRNHIPDDYTKKYGVQSRLDAFMINPRQEQSSKRQKMDSEKVVSSKKSAMMSDEGFLIPDDSE